MGCISNGFKILATTEPMICSLEYTYPGSPTKYVDKIKINKQKQCLRIYNAMKEHITVARHNDNHTWLTSSMWFARIVILLIKYISSFLNVRVVFSSVLLKTQCNEKIHTKNKNLKAFFLLLLHLILLFSFVRSQLL